LLLGSSLEDAIHARELIPGFFVFRMIVLRQLFSIERRRK
jgi:hypothetical protein